MIELFKKIKNWLRKFFKMKLNLNRQGFRVETKEQRNVLSTLLYVIVIFALITVGAMVFKMLIIAYVALSFAVIISFFCCYKFSYFAVKNPTLLMSEKHQIRIMQLEQIKQENKKVALENSEIEEVGIVEVEVELEEEEENQ